MSATTEKAPDKPRLSLWDHEVRLAQALDALAEAEADADTDAMVRATVQDYALTAAEKRDRMAWFLIECDSRAELYAAEAARMTARRRAMERASERLRSYVVGVMEAFGAHKLEGVSHTLALVKNPSRVEVTGEVPDAYTRTIPAQVEPDKVKIREAIERGEVVPNARLIEGGVRLSVK